MVFPRCPRIHSTRRVKSHAVQPPLYSAFSTSLIVMPPAPEVGTRGSTDPALRLQSPIAAQRTRLQVRQH